jgi:hypothetical protein
MSVILVRTASVLRLVAAIPCRGCADLGAERPVADIVAMPRAYTVEETRGVMDSIYTHPSSTEALNEVFDKVV